MKKKSVMTVIIISFVLCAFSANAENIFTGCYAKLENGNPSVKIHLQASNFFVELKKGGKWSRRTKLHKGKIDEISRILKKDASKIKDSLVADKNRPFMIFYVNEGEVYNGKKAKTDYLAFIMMGGGSLYKVKCD